MNMTQPTDSLLGVAPQVGSILRDAVIASQPIKLSRRGLVLHEALPSSLLGEGEHPINQTSVEKPVDIQELLSEARRLAYADGHAAAKRELELKAAQESQQTQKQAQDTGYKEGYATGLEAAKSDASAELKRALSAQEKDWAKRQESLAHMLKEGSEKIGSRLNEIEEEAVTLVFEAVAGVLGETLSEEQGIRAMVAQLISKRKSSTQFVVHLNPEDWKMIAQNDQANQKPEAVEWVADSKVAHGGIILRHSQGKVDATLDTIMNNLRTMMLGVYERRRETRPSQVSGSVSPMKSTT